MEERLYHVHHCVEFFRFRSPSAMCSRTPRVNENAQSGVAQTLCRSKSAVLNMVNVHFL